VIEVAEGLGEGWRRSSPLRCRVNGGYTISKLRGSAGADSAETLITCVLQVRRAWSTSAAHVVAQGAGAVLAPGAWPNGAATWVAAS
jgi:hypothetical protein